MRWSDKDRQKTQMTARQAQVKQRKSDETMRARARENDNILHKILLEVIVQPLLRAAQVFLSIHVMDAPIPLMNTQGN